MPSLYDFTLKSDVVIVEQRGNGLATPNLTCPGSFNLPLDEPLRIEKFSQVYRDYINGCKEFWQEKSRDLSSYNVISMADDINDIRKSLNHDKIMLFGGSFGSHHGLTYAKNYPKHVDRILVDSPEGLTHTVKLPLNVDRILKGLSKMVSRDTILNNKIPSFIKMVKRQIQSLETSPIKVDVKHPETNEWVQIVVGGYDLQLITASLLGRKEYRELPYRYLQMQEGDYSWLAQRAINIRVNQDENLMPVLTDCASGAKADRWLKLKKQSKKAILGDALNSIRFKVCDSLPNLNLSNELSSDFYTEIPIVLIYGSQDARTPPSNTQDIMKHFKNAHTIRVKNGSHDLFKEVWDEIKPVMINYLTAPNPKLFSSPAIIEAPVNFKVHK
ncbi:alpha/beta hydrolase [Pontimicrobium aquaticum]|uniref:Alpha/beta hydrolase n=1 Tax=Pontimicrobium aquaticum TaxID=2565367 RepID=A0A4U0F0A5_9FLAO|nr:alpha/beta hydrolase [Pontimicrobium aquaticum]